MAGKLKITLVKSTIGAIPKHRKTVEALGLKKLNKTVEMPDNAATRGQIQELQDLVLKVVSCHCIEDCQREGLQTSTAKILLELV